MGSGNSKQNLNSFDPSVEGWQLVQTIDNAKIWRNRDTAEQVEEYQQVFNDQQIFDKEKDMFQFRYNSNNLVAAKYYRQDVQKDMCSTFYKGNLFLERIPLRLSQIKEIPYPDGLHLYQQTLRGFAELYDKVGYFEVDEDLVCMNQQGKVKTWCNCELARSHPEKKFADQDVPRTELQMLRRTTRMLDANLDHSTFPENLTGMYMMTQPRTFKDAHTLLEQYCAKHRVFVPEEMRCILEMRPEQILNGKAPISKNKDRGANYEYFTPGENNKGITVAPVRTISDGTMRGGITNRTIGERGPPISNPFSKGPSAVITPNGGNIPITFAHNSKSFIPGRVVAPSPSLTTGPRFLPASTLPVPKVVTLPPAPAPLPVFYPPQPAPQLHSSIPKSYVQQVPIFRTNTTVNSDLQSQRFLASVSEGLAKIQAKQFDPNVVDKDIQKFTSAVTEPIKGKLTSKKVSKNDLRQLTQSIQNTINKNRTALDNPKAETIKYVQERIEIQSPAEKLLSDASKHFNKSAYSSRDDWASKEKRDTPILTTKDWRATPTNDAFEGVSSSLKSKYGTPVFDSRPSEEGYTSPELLNLLRKPEIQNYLNLASTTGTRPSYEFMKDKYNPSIDYQSKYPSMSNPYSGMSGATAGLQNTGLKLDNELMRDLEKLKARQKEERLFSSAHSFGTSAR